MRASYMAATHVIVGQRFLQPVKKASAAISPGPRAVRRERTVAARGGSNTRTRAVEPPASDRDTSPAQGRHQERYREDLPRQDFRFETHAAAGWARAMHVSAHGSMPCCHHHAV